MNDSEKNINAYKTIGEVARELNLIDKKTGHLQTHTIRYWETQFNQIKPKIMAGKRRYYSFKDLQILKHIKFLLKDEGLTIIGAKKLLEKSKTQSLDDNKQLGIYSDVLKKNEVIKNKVKKISKIIKQLKEFK